MNPNYWKDKKVFITGATGFKGAWLCLMLHKMGAEVYGYSKGVPTIPCLYQLAQTWKTDGKYIGDTRGDIRNLDLLKKSLAISNPSHVIHLAAQAIVREGFANPLDTFETNIMGTANVLEACRENPNVSTVLIVTTDKVYGEHPSIWGYRETDPVDYADPYSTSKACAELVTGCYRSTFMQKYGKKVATARAGNVIGGGDFAYRIVPMTMESLMKDTAPVVWDPNAARPWQYVLDCLNGYLTLLELAETDPKTYVGAWNFGPPITECMTVGALVDKLTALWSGGIVNWDRVGCPDQYNLNVDIRLDAQKAAVYLGWKPKFELEDTVKAIVDWYHGYQRGENVREICDLELMRYGL